MNNELPFPTAVRKQTLAEQVAASIKEAILAGRWQPGEALPTEPELAELFGVSRAVVRDATRMLVAQGLVDAQHGRGVFVTESQVEAFGDALLLALRREGATVWDVEQFEQMVFPEVCALAAEEILPAELAQLRELAAHYTEVHKLAVAAEEEGTDTSRETADTAMLQAFRAFIAAIFAATHNALWKLLAQPLLRQRSARDWETDPEESSAAQLAALEKLWIDTLVAVIAGGDADEAREAVRRLMQLPVEAQQAMRQTPVGEKAHIRLNR
ncbi:MAG: FadR/GntR family transcriptional regulator [Candidatus Promineifilaceae bacterium]